MEQRYGRKNTELFNKIKEARTIEEKVHLAVEYFENTCNINDDMRSWLNINEIREILNIVGSYFDDKIQRPINPDYLSDFCELIKEGQQFTICDFCSSSIGRALKKLEIEISKKLLAIFRGINRKKL